MRYGAIYMIYDLSTNLYRSKTGWTSNKYAALGFKRLATIQRHFNSLSLIYRESCVITER